MTKTQTRRLLLSLLILLPTLGQGLRAQPLGTDTVPSTQQVADGLLLQGVVKSLPIVSAGLLQTLNNRYVRELRFAYYPRFRHHYDDYLQFAPLAGQLGLRLVGVRGVTESPLQMVTADALASLSMLAITSAIKYTARVERPDGSSRNSFPSGHTAMAFTSAELLSIEYGERYPWIRPIGYAVASATGIGRLLNNRHWVGDVLTGAGLGILSAHIGYWASDRLFGRSRRQRDTVTTYPTRTLLYLPIGASSRYTGQRSEWYSASRALGLGVEHTPTGWPLYLQAEAQLTLEHIYRRAQVAVEPSAETRALRLSLGVGHSFALWYDLGVNVTARGSLIGLQTGRVLHPTELASVSVPHLALGMGMEVTPHWRFTRHLGLRVPCGVDYVPSGIELKPLGSDATRLRGITYHIATSLEVHF